MWGKLRKKIKRQKYLLKRKFREDICPTLAYWCSRFFQLEFESRFGSCHFGISYEFIPVNHDRVLFGNYLSTCMPKNVTKDMFWYRFTDLFVDIGSGHGELVLLWNRLTRWFPEFTLDPLLEKTGLRDPRRCCFEFYDDSFSGFFSGIIGFETRSRYFEAIREDLIRFKRARYYYMKMTASYGRQFYVPNALIFKEDGFSATRKFKDESVSGFFVLFPDPWNKKKHRKRRRVTYDWILTAFYKLIVSGFILIVTDHKDYISFIKNELVKVKRVLGDSLEIKIEEDFKPTEWGLVPTHYYKKQIQGKPVAFLLSRKDDCV